MVTEKEGGTKIKLLNIYIERVTTIYGREGTICGSDD